MALRTFIAHALMSLAGPVPPGAPPDDLRFCAACHGPLVCPMDWETSDDTHWRIVTRCGDCGHRRETIVSNERAARLDRDMDRDMDVIRRAADRLDFERMEAETDAFAAALAHDLIAASDFG